MRAWLDVLVFMVMVFIGPVGWCVHLYRCFTEEQWGFLVAGAIFFPIGVIHGWGVVFGIW